jgi:hypothetical protein
MVVHGRLGNAIVRHLIVVIRLASHHTLASIYRIPLQAPAAMARDIKSNAIKLEAVLHDVEVKHPLVRQAALQFVMKQC